MEIWSIIWRCDRERDVTLRERDVTLRERDRRARQGSDSSDLQTEIGRKGGSILPALTDR